MAIKVNGVNVIDDSRNFSAAGIVTVGSGNSATIINGTTGITSVGIGITLNGITGNVSIAGTLTAAGFNIPGSIISFNPANGATGINTTQNTITLTFNQAVGIATTGTVLLRKGSVGGTTQETIGVSQIQPSPNGIVIRINSGLGFSTSYFPVIPNGFIKFTSGSFAGLNTTGADSYSFTTRSLGPGDAFGGGTIICQSGGTRWIVAPSSSEVSRNWYNRANANTTAQSVSGCTGWFVPTIGQLSNPGYTCRIYWDSYSPSIYWSDTDYAIGNGRAINFSNGSPVLAPSNEKPNTYLVRSFRCVSY